MALKESTTAINNVLLLYFSLIHHYSKWRYRKICWYFKNANHLAPPLIRINHHFTRFRKCFERTFSSANCFISVCVYSYQLVEGKRIRLQKQKLSKQLLMTRQIIRFWLTRRHVIVSATSQIVPHATDWWEEKKIEKTHRKICVKNIMLSII